MVTSEPSATITLMQTTDSIFTVHTVSQGFCFPLYLAISEMPKSPLLDSNVLSGLRTLPEVHPVQTVAPPILQVLHHSRVSFRKRILMKALPQYLRYQFRVLSLIPIEAPFQKSESIATCATRLQSTSCWYEPYRSRCLLCFMCTTSLAILGPLGGLSPTILRGIEHDSWQRGNLHHLLPLGDLTLKKNPFRSRKLEPMKSSLLWPTYLHLRMKLSAFSSILDG